MRGVAAGDGESALLQFGLGQGEGVLVGHREAGGDHPRLSFDEGEAVVAGVRAQVRHARFPAVDEFQADDAGGEVERPGEVGGAGPDVGDMVSSIMVPPAGPRTAYSLACGRPTRPRVITGWARMRSVLAGSCTEPVIMAVADS